MSKSEKEVTEKGYKGAQYGGKSHILDCMEMLVEIWEGKTGKYVSKEGICRCLRKADILPVAWNADINNDIGRASTSIKHNTIEKIETDELCSLLTGVKLKTEKCRTATTSAVGRVFADSFVTYGNVTNDDLKAMAMLIPNKTFCKKRAPH